MTTLVRPGFRHRRTQRNARRLCAALLSAFAASPLMPTAVAAQDPAGPGRYVDGSLSLMVDALPDADAAVGRQTTAEGRVRLFVERRQSIGDHVRLNLAGYVDGFLASRPTSWSLASGGPSCAIAASSSAAFGSAGPGSAASGGAASCGAAPGNTTRAAPSRSSAVRDATLRPTDLYVEFMTSRFDVRAGASRVVWGRLDEFQPTDVVNPIDLSRFLLEGRSEARLAVGLVSGRIKLPGATTIEAVVVPGFRSGRFDQLGEATSPFNLARVPGLPLRRDEPAFGRQSVQGGARATSTVGRLDVGASVYRGLRAFPTSTIEGLAPPASTDADRAAFLGEAPDAVQQPLAVVQTFPRFTMIGGDFETVAGAWGLRGEVAAFVDDQLQSTRAARGVPGASVEGGVGVDRRAGDYRVALNVLVGHRSPDRSDPVGAAFIGDDEVDRIDMALVAAVDRSFVKQTRTLRVFTVYDPADRTAFVRAIGAVSLRDNLWIEGSGGLFAGSSLDTIGRLTNRDFAYARLKVFF